jgi:cell wall-associated NlpC family hydrolase
VPGSTLRAHARSKQIALTTSVALLVGAAVAAPAAAGPTSQSVGASAVLTASKAGSAAPAAAKRWPVLRYGSRGSAVTYVQARLGVERTGKFGTRTRAAVKAFESEHGLLVNGVVGASIWRRLDVPKVKAAAKKSSSSKLRPGTAAWGSAVLKEARKHKGAPYRHGAAGPAAFDCSGFVQYTVRKATGKKLPRTAAAMRGATKRIGKSQAKAGDLVFVSRGGRISHVAIYDGKGRWWEATRPGRPLNLNRPWTSSVSYGRVR